MGFWLKTPYEDAYREIFKATMVLNHRGPDGSGVYLDRETGVGLGHTRLSIIDLSPLARQPMASEDQSVWVVYNGEIYNFMELRQYLISKGFQFKSRSDTEVILKGYIHWGTELFSHLNGMFAFAIWDKREKMLLLARDRVGKKPLYYTLQDRGLFFASELKALVVFSGLIRNIDMDALASYFHYQYVPTPHTIYEGFYKLEPGAFIIFSDGPPRKHRYWVLPEWVVSRENSHEHPEIREELREKLKRAVRSRLISDVPIGCLLSGGNDSSLVTAIAQEVSGARLNTFTISFKDKDYDEGPFAREVAKILGTAHTEMTLSPKEALEIISKIPVIYDEPFGDSSGIPTFLVCKLASSHVKVVITGDGGDEQFGGYVRYWAVDSMLAMQRRFRPLLNVASKFMKAIPEGMVIRCYELIKDYLPQRYRMGNIKDKYQKLLKILSVDDLEAIYRLTIGIFSKEATYHLLKRDVVGGSFEEVIRKEKAIHPMLRLMEVDQNTYLPDCMLTKVDRASMANGLEVRCPLLDTELFEFTKRLGIRDLYGNKVGKKILKELLRAYLPVPLIEREKTGFGVPLERWFRKELREMVCDYLSPERIKKEGIFDEREVQTYIKEHLSGESNHQHRLWVLLVWEMWRETWC